MIYFIENVFEIKGIPHSTSIFLYVILSFPQNMDNVFIILIMKAPNAKFLIAVRNP